MDYEGVIDREILDNLLAAVDGDNEFLVELLDTYFEDSPQQFAAMHKALTDQDSEGLRRAAHSLKSNSANFGAMELSQKAKDLEELGRIGNLDQAGELLAGAENEYEKVKSTLETIQKEG